VKLRLVKLDEKTLKPGDLTMVAARQLGPGRPSFFPARLEQWVPGEIIPGQWVPVQFEEGLCLKQSSCS
jgi:hypothetical protein